MVYKLAGEFKFLSIVTGVSKYMALTNKVYVDLTEPSLYNDIINHGTSDYHWENKSEDNDVRKEAWATYLSDKEGII